MENNENEEESTCFDEICDDEVMQEVLTNLESKEYLNTEDGQTLLKELEYFCDKSICQCDVVDLCFSNDNNLNECNETSQQIDDSNEIFETSLKYERCSCKIDECICPNKAKCPNKQHKDIIRVTDVDYLAISVKVKQESTKKCSNISLLKTTEDDFMNEDTFKIKVVVDEGHLTEIVKEGEDDGLKMEDQVFGIIRKTELANYSESGTDTGKTVKEETMTVTESFQEKYPQDSIKTKDNNDNENESSLQKTDRSDDSKELSLITEYRNDNINQSNNDTEKETITSNKSSNSIPMVDYEEPQITVLKNPVVVDSEVKEHVFIKEFIENDFPKNKCNDICSMDVSSSASSESKSHINFLEKFITSDLSSELLFNLDDTRLKKKASVREIIRNSKIHITNIYEDAESNYAPRDEENEVENARYHKIIEFANILINDTFERAEEIVKRQKLKMSQMALHILNQKEEALRETSKSKKQINVDEEEKITLPTNSSFNIICGYKFIDNLIQNWTRDITWRYCINLIDRYTDNSTDFYIYETLWSIPTSKNPIPIATASIFFEFRVSQIKPKTYPIEVQYNFEFSRFIHYPGKTKFKEKWLYDILRLKEKMFDLLRF